MSGPGSPLLEVEDLRVQYGQSRALHGVNIEVAEGSVVVLLGANGAGKTTLLRTISGVVGGRGSIRYSGRSILGTPPARLVRRGLVQVPENRGTFSDLTVRENLRLGAYSRKQNNRETENAMSRVVDTFPILGERSEQRAGLLSGGEQQMLAIGRALMAGPRLLLLDEPSLGLAPTITQSVFATLRELHQATGLSMLIVEQNAHLSLEIADHAYVIEAGVIKFDGPAAAVRDDDALRRAYLGY